MPPVRRVPQRTCVACRQVKAKRELIRVVRGADGSLEVDISGRKIGRGAYLCRSRECWEAGLKGGRLGHALRATIERAEAEKLVRYLEGAS